jgi:hypothetical protein
MRHLSLSLRFEVLQFGHRNSWLVENEVPQSTRGMIQVPGIQVCQSPRYSQADEKPMTELRIAIDKSGQSSE